MRPRPTPAGVRNGVQYALNKLHAIPNVDNYVDIAHSGVAGVAQQHGPGGLAVHVGGLGTTAGVNSVDGFISDTANYTPITEPHLTATESVGGQPVDSADFDITTRWDELTDHQAMYSNLVGAGFPTTIGCRSTPREWPGAAGRPTAASTSTDLNTFVKQPKMDQGGSAVTGATRTTRAWARSRRPIRFRRSPTCTPTCGSSRRASPTATTPPPSSPRGPALYPNGTNTDGSGNTYPTNASRGTMSRPASGSRASSPAGPQRLGHPTPLPTKNPNWKTKRPRAQRSVRVRPGPLACCPDRWGQVASGRASSVKLARPASRLLVRGALEADRDAGTRRDGAVIAPRW